VGSKTAINENITGEIDTASKIKTVKITKLVQIMKINNTTLKPSTY
jgi:hypothetical protein